MSTETKTCPNCSSLMSHDHSDMKNVYYKCPCCGYNDIVPLEQGEADIEYERQKHELQKRLHMGLVNWEVTDWNQLYQDINDFIANFEAARMDLQFQMSLAACLTKGFNIIDADTYAKCKKLFKVTEKMYKAHLKYLKQQADPALSESVSDYKESRAKYIKCRNEYLNTKAMWKVLFFLLKKISLPI